MDKYALKKLVFITFLLVNFQLFAQNSAFTIFNSKGKKVTFEKMLQSVSSKKVVFFGEFHNDPIAHWLQLELAMALHQKDIPMTIGAEMFERDNDSIIQAYFEGKITQKQFEDSCRLWSNYKTDYKPLLEFAKANGISYRATNIPRRYASKLYKQGRLSLDTLSAEEKSWIAPLDFPVDTTLSQYNKLLSGFAHSNITFVEAQAIKDATMGYFTGKYLNKIGIFLHLNGSFHSDYYQGILWYLNYYYQITYDQMGTISTVSQAQIKKLAKEHLGKADFIICTPERITKTH